MTEQDLPDKEPNFLRNLSPPRHIKNQLFKGSRIQQQIKHRLTEEARLELGFNMNNSSPLSKRAPLHLRRFPIGQITIEPKRDKILISHQNI